MVALMVPDRKAGWVPFSRVRARGSHNVNLADLSLQTALAQLAIALSVFSLITYLWLGLTVLLIGNRSSMVTWTGGLGLLMAALFFLCHGALVGAGVPSGSLGQ